jgi:hypothetical protein
MAAVRKGYHGLFQRQPPLLRAWTRKLGTINVVALIISTLSIWASLGFISFLWAQGHLSSHDLPTTTTWLSIINAGWLSRAITLAALLLRTAITVEAGVCASMLASLIIELGGSNLFRAPQLSIARTTSSHPAVLLWAAIGGLTRETRLLYVLVLGLVVFTTVTSNFTSTILLSDLVPGTLINAPQRATLNISFAQQRPSPPSYAQTAPPAFPIFAEYNESPFKKSDVSDTGLTIRAFPPFNASGRTSLRNYSGPAMLLDSRVTCVNPGVQGISFEIEPPDMDNPDTMYIVGQISYNQSLPMFLYTWNYDIDPDPILYFNCTVPVYYPEETSSPRLELDWQIAACFLLNNANLRTSFNESIPGWQSFLMMNTTGRGDAWMNLNQTSKGNGTITQDLFSRQQDEGEWLKYEGLNSTALAFTICATGFQAAQYNVTMQGRSMSKEPTLDQWSPSTYGYETDTVRQMYGATGENTTLTNRGVVSLSKGDWTVDFLDGAWLKTMTDALDKLNAGQSYRDATIILCTGCASGAFQFSQYTKGSSIAVDSVHLNIFQDILRTTRRPAYALQTFLTIIMQTFYYDYLPQYDVAGPATVQFFQSSTIPMHWTGYGVVVSIALIHLTLTAITTYWFLTRTQSSFLSDFWLTLSQTCNGDVGRVLVQIPEQSDRAVQEWMQQEELNGVSTGLAASEEAGVGRALAMRKSSSPSSAE